MPNPRTVTNITDAQHTKEGAGVFIWRSIGKQDLPELDPFLLLDSFGTDNPDDYIAGFPDHPHRGFETVTYMIEGSMRHKDSTGAEGLLGPGSIQWMTAGKGIVHSEMPEQKEGKMQGFQLWVNLPAADKMCEPRYQNIDPKDVPVVTTDDGAVIRVLTGTANGVTGPVTGISVDPVYIDIAMKSGSTHTQPITPGHTTFVYAFEGSIEVAGTTVGINQLALLSDGDEVTLTSQNTGRAILISGAPIGEPIARYGPFVMNTKEEISQAINDFQSGSFL
ncbi:MAG: pirin family protein [Rhodospirillales bacterium]|nr:pirin family protein [Rhodospirillales bacterium]